MSSGRCSQGFIKKYVQCYSCGNPETVVKVRKENIFLKCKACGAVSDVDARHKLNTYILKNPPEEKVSKAEKKCATYPPGLAGIEVSSCRELPGPQAGLLALRSPFLSAWVCKARQIRRVV